MLWEPCHIAFGQPIEFFIHFLPLLVGENALHPKHDPDLHFQRQHTTKRLVLGIHQPSKIHTDGVKPATDLSTPHHLINPPFSTDPLLAPGPLNQGRKKCTHGGYPLEYPFVHIIPRDISPPIKFSEGVCKTRCAPSVGSFHSVQFCCSIW